ncbi:hypothetical protein KAR91_54030 [Candidatus Pacearchaeota archaeon]|nr:hypothetical protein [Candidatus Pacearchaeota archaeon]
MTIMEKIFTIDKTVDEILTTAAGIELEREYQMAKKTIRHENIIAAMLIFFTVGVLIFKLIG